MQAAIAISIGAILGALLRWKIGEYYNPLFPTIPLGTLLVNLLGGFLMGTMVFLSVEHTFFSPAVRLGVITGFLGSLTTFSTFAGEAFVLLARQELFWLASLLLLHVVGSIGMVIVGYLISKLVFKSLGE
jgi:CrcB protein